MSQYKQVGNAVPVNLALEVAKQLKLSLENKNKIEEQSEQLFMEDIMMMNNN